MLPLPVQQLCTGGRWYVVVTLAWYWAEYGSLVSWYSRGTVKWYGEQTWSGTGYGSWYAHSRVIVYGVRQPGMLICAWYCAGYGGLIAWYAHTSVVLFGVRRRGMLTRAWCCGAGT